MSPAMVQKNRKAMPQTDAWRVKKARREVAVDLIERSILRHCRSGFENPGAMCYLKAGLQCFFVSDDV